MSTQKMKKPEPIAARVDELTTLLLAQLEDYRQLLALIHRKSEAVRHARLDVIAEIFNHERSMVERIGESERRRIRLLHEISAAMQPGSDKPLRVSEIAQAHADEEARDRLLAISEELRAVAMEVRARSSRVRAAAEALARHMNGIMQSVRSALSRAGVYENKGRLALGTQLDFSVDVRS